MAAFSFGDSLGSSQSTGGKGLEGNKIHDVKFEGAVKERLADQYEVLKLKFSNDEGTHEHAIFEPREEDFVRKNSEFTDRKTGKPITIPNASNVESMMLLLKHVIDAVDPELGEKIDKKEFGLGGKNWDELRDNMVKIFARSIGKETSIKLINDNKGYGQLPRYFTGVNDEGKAYIKTNFVGKKLGFTPQEMNRMKTMAAATPTAMTMDDPIADDLPDDLGDLNMNFDVDSL